jgi:hypothetical protein
MTDFRFWKYPHVMHRLDLIFGLRAWGLLLYGVLPANLALIGTLEVKLGKVDNLLPYIIPVSLLPICITYMLILTRHRNWYLTTELLRRRTLLTTLLILLLASLISGAAGILQGRYVLKLTNLWDQRHLLAMAESFLFGISTLVLTSTLFMTLLTKGGELPGIPSPAFAEQLTLLRAGLRQVKASEIWEWERYQGKDEVTSALKNRWLELENVFINLNSNSGDSLAKISLRPVHENLQLFFDAVDYVASGGSEELKYSDWGVFFEIKERLTENQMEERARLNKQFSAVQQLSLLPLGE